MAPKRKAPSKSPAKRTRRAKTAAKLLQGKTVDQIATETGVSRATAYRDAASPEVDFLVSRALNARQHRLNLLLDKALVRIEEALDARLVVIIREKDKRDRPALLRYGDHKARLAAVQRLMKLCILGRALPRASESDDRPITYEQFQRLLESYMAQIPIQ